MLESRRAYLLLYEVGMEGIGKMLIFAGGLIILLGLLTIFMGKTGFKLPGDIIIQKGNFTFFFPIITFLLLSLLFTLFLNLFFYFFK